MAKQQQEETKTYNFNIGPLISAFSNLITAVGIPGAIVVSAILFLFYGISQDRKDEFFDKYVLFKDTCENHYIFIILVLGASYVFYAQQTTFKKLLRMKDEEMKRISDEKTKLQQQRVKKALNKSE